MSHSLRAKLSGLHYKGILEDKDYKRLCKALDLEKAEQEQKSGKWRHYENMLTCSQCKAEFYDEIMEYCGDDVPRFCPDCGACMKDGRTLDEFIEDSKESEDKECMK